MDVPSSSVTSRPLLVAGFAAVLGAALAATSPLWAATALTALLVTAAASRTATPILAAAALAVGLVAGTAERARTDATLRAVGAAWPRAPPGPVEFALEVTRCGEDPFHGRAWLEGRPPEGPGVRCSFPGRLPEGVGPKAAVRVAGRCRAPLPPGNPGESDRRAALAARDIAWECELKSADNVQVERPAPLSFAGFLSGIRRRAATRLFTALPADVAPLAVAFLLGDRTGLAEEDRLLFDKTGTNHVLAISGMHVVLLAAMVHALLRALGLGPRAAAAATLLLALAYVPIAGAGAPVRRAVYVLAFHALALVRGRPPDAASALGGAALVLALTDPAEALSIGSVLSFVAAAAIVWLAAPWHDRWSLRYRMLRRFPAVRRDRPLQLLVSGYLLSAVPVSLAAWLFTLALVARAFGIVTPYALVVNIVAGPLVSLLLGAAALVALAVPGAGTAAVLLTRALRAVLAWGASLPGCLWVVPPPPLAAVVIWMAGCVVLRWRPRLALPMLALAVVVAVACRPKPPASPELTLLDVGHGQAALLRWPDGGTVLVDAGSRTRQGLGRAVLLPAFRELGVTRLDLVVVTHADADHWNAVPLLLRRFPVGALVTGPDPPPELLRAASDGQVPWIVVRGRGVLRPGLSVVAVGSSALRNDASIVLLFDGGGHRVLLPADREERGLREILAQGLPRCDVLVAPHHGAGCDEALALGRAVSPRLLLVSSARGFPDPATLRGYGAPETLATFEAGALRVRFLGDQGIEAVSFRRRDRATIRAP